MRFPIIQFARAWLAVHQATKAERDRREVRYYTPDRLGPRCPRCLAKVPIRLANTGQLYHPLCDPASRDGCGELVGGGGDGGGAVVVVGHGVGFSCW